MKLTKTEFLDFLRTLHCRTKVGDKQNPLRSFLNQQGLSLNAVLAKRTTPKWVRTFVEKVQTREGRTISANAAKNLLNII